VRILTLVSYYHPGFKAGGPIRTLVSMVEHLGDSFEFWILTGDRDYKDHDPFDHVPLTRWVSVGKAQVYYIDIKTLALSKLKALINEVNPDIVYLNSLFSPLANKYLLARRLRMIPNVPTLAAPRGVFSSGALQIKRFKKRAYLFAARGSGLFKGLHWQASSTAEKKDICTILPGIDGRRIFVAPDIPPLVKKDDDDYLESSQKPIKEVGQVRFIFLSRITPVKNLRFVLALFHSIEGRIKFDLFGPVQDFPYWENCQEIIAGLPPNVQVQYHGPVPHKEVRKLFSNAHFFILPTLGENFGHAILESLIAGCPVIISDRTPWNDLSEGKAGWVIPLEENQTQWIDILQTSVDMDQGEYSTYSNNAGQYAQWKLASPYVFQVNQDMFLSMIE
jgi:glycosyltransferase involved in cell wall biosynthesis